MICTHFAVSCDCLIICGLSQGELLYVGATTILLTIIGRFLSYLHGEFTTSELTAVNNAVSFLLDGDNLIFSGWLERAL